MDGAFIIPIPPPIPQQKKTKYNGDRQAFEQFLQGLKLINVVRQDWDNRRQVYPSPRVTYRKRDNRLKVSINDACDHTALLRRPPNRRTW